MISILALALALLVPAAGAQEAPAPLLLILDASGSMWGQIEGENKIVIARRVLGGLVDGLPDASEVGLVAYGHRREGDCDDIETLVPLGALDKASLKATVNALSPKGKTPITRSLEQAFDALRAHGGGATVILVSDGLETCGGDPCAAVRAAREQGVELILHVIGFDVAGEDVSQLECAAQAGGGLFLSAENAGELGAALEAAVAMPVDTPPGRLVVKAVADGELHDAAVSVVDAEGKGAAVSRTYERPETNPRSIPLPDGKFEVEVRSVRLKGAAVRRFAIEIAGGSTVEKDIDFSSGEIVIGATRNGELSDALYHVYAAGTREVAASGRTYRSASSNPKTVRIIAGSYDVEMGAVEIAGKPIHAFGRVEVAPKGRVELAHDFQSATLRVGAVRGAALVDAGVHVVDAATGKGVDQSRTYTSANSNPSTFVLLPGTYKVKVTPIKLEGNPKQEFEVTVAAGETVERQADF